MRSKLMGVALGAVIGGMIGSGSIDMPVAETPIKAEIDVCESEIPTTDVAIQRDVCVMLAALAEAEAGNQDQYGKRLVVDTVLNRVHSDRFPDTIVEVVYQPNQFSVVSNGEIRRYISGVKEIPDENYEIVLEELVDQADYEVVFFQSSGWSPYGERAYKYGDHYFSK